MNLTTRTAAAALLVACATSALAQAPGTGPTSPSPGAQAAPPAPTTPRPAAQAPRTGAYLIAAVARGEYDYDCFSFICDTARGTGGKLGVGYRLGVFGIEGWWTDLGKGTTRSPDGTLRLRAMGVNGIWTMRFGEHFEGMLRAGGADVRYTRVRNGVSETSNRFQPTFGLGVSFIATPQLNLELAGDLTRGEDGRYGTMLTSWVSLGARLRF